MTTLTILYLIFAKDASIKENKFITPTIMKRVLYIRAIKNKVRGYFSKGLERTFRKSGIGFNGTSHLLLLLIPQKLK